MANLTDLSPYIYGTTRLGDEAIPFPERVLMARTAMNAGIWIHSSHQYGEALSVLRTAFDEDGSRVPPGIFKLGWNTVDEVRSQVQIHTEALDIPSLAIGQLCPGGQLAEDLRNGGDSLAGLAELKKEGLVERFVMEVWPWTSMTAQMAIQGGFAEGLIDGYIFYLNPLQRFVRNDLWDILMRQKHSVIAMRTVAGGSIKALRENDRAPKYLRHRAAEVEPLFHSSGIDSWTEFSVRFALGIGQVQATVGSTAKRENFLEFQRAAKKAEELPEEIMDAILALHRKWSEDHDSHAEPWSM